MSVPALSLLLVCNGKTTSFAIEQSLDSITVATFKEMVQTTLNLETCKILNLPKLSKDKSENNSTLADLKLKGGMKLMVLGLALTAEKIAAKLAEAEKLKSTQLSQDYDRFNLQNSQLKQEDIAGYQDTKKRDFTSTTKKSHDFDQFEYYRFIWLCSTGNAPDAEMLYRNNSHKFDLRNARFASQTLEAAIVGNSLMLVKYVLERHYVPFQVRSDEDLRLKIRSERIVRENQRVQRLIESGASQELIDKTKSNILEKQTQEDNFESNRQFLYGNRLNPLNMYHGLFTRIVKQGRLEILKYLCEEWLLKYWVPEFLNLTPKQRYDHLIRYVPPLRKCNETEITDEEDRKRYRHDFYLRWFQGQSVAAQTTQAYEYFCTELLLAGEWSLTFGEWPTLLYVLGFLRTHKRLEHPFLVNLVIGAQSRGNRYIYSDLLQNWEPNAPMVEGERAYIEYVKQNQNQVNTRLKEQFTNLQNINYCDAVVMLQVELYNNPRWKHWMPCRYLISQMSDGHPSWMFDWLIERDRSLLTWELIDRMCFERNFNHHQLSELSGKWNLLYHICTSPHRYLYALPAPDLEPSELTALTKHFTQSFGTTDPTLQIEIDDVDGDLLRVLIWLLKNRYLQFFLPQPTDEVIPIVYLIAQALMEKRELVADHLAKALSGQMESIQKIRTAVQDGDIEMSAATEVSPHYMQKMVHFDVSVARRIVFYMQGGSGYNHAVYVKRGNQCFGENWRQQLKDHIESLREKRLQQIGSQQIAQQDFVESKLNSLSGWDKMVAEADELRKIEVSENAHEINDLLNRRKENLLTLTASRHDFDLQDIASLTSLL